MKNPELFHKTIGILVNAYLKGTIKQGECAACVVGNLIAANMSYEVKEIWRGEWRWECEGYSDNDAFRWFDVIVNNYHIDEKVEEQVESTGYTIDELKSLEQVFEDVAYRFDEKVGLMSVVNKLCEIHEMDLTTKEEAKALFVKVS